MPPVADVSEHVRRRMSNTRGRDTRPEVALRRELHRRHLRYRVNYRADPELRRTVDIAFTRARIAVFVDGCFWHGCPAHYRPATTRAEFWSGKIQGNVERDADTTKRLQQAGWLVLRFWEHEESCDAADVVEAAVLRFRASR